MTKGHSVTVTLDNPQSLRQVWERSQVEVLGATPFAATWSRDELAPHVQFDKIALTAHRRTPATAPAPIGIHNRLVVSAVLEGVFRARENDLRYEAGPGAVFIYKEASISWTCLEPSRIVQSVIPASVLPPVAGLHRPLGLCAPSRLTDAYFRFATDIFGSRDVLPTAPQLDASLSEAALVLQQALIRSAAQGRRAPAIPAAQLRLEVLQHVEQRLSDHTLTPDDIAEQFAISRRWLFRLFEGEEETLGQIIRRRRAETAAQYMQAHPRAKVQDVAWHHGFFGRDQFTRAFRARHGLSPAEYRAGIIED